MAQITNIGCDHMTIWKFLWNPTCKSLENQCIDYRIDADGPKQHASRTKTDRYRKSRKTRWFTQFTQFTQTPLTKRVRNKQPRKNESMNKKKTKQNSKWTWTLNYFDLVGPSSDRTRPAANVIWSVWISFIILFRHLMELHSIILNRRHRRRLRHRHCCASNQAFILFASHFKVDFDSKFILFNILLLLFSSIRFFKQDPFITTRYVNQIKPVIDFDKNAFRHCSSSSDDAIFQGTRSLWKLPINR